jgi:transglutaminase-like putative cysteine protease
MERERTRATAYTFSAVCGEILLFQAVRCLLGSQFSGWDLSLKSQLIIQLVLLVPVLVHGVLAPLCPVRLKLTDLFTAVMCITVGVLYAWRNQTLLGQGYLVLYTDYITLWNREFHTNYMGYDVGRDALGMTIGFTILALLILCWFLRILFDARLFLLIPWIAVLSMGLLVNAKPGWMGLALCFVEVLVIYAVPFEATRISVREDCHKKDRRPAGKMLSAHIITVALIGAGMVLLSGIGFRGIAAKIPEKSFSFIAFQSRLEEEIRKVEDFGYLFSVTQERLDNSTPEYRDTEILTIHASACPNTNLYLKDFYSGTYSRSRWEAEGDAFSQSAKEAGYDADEIGLLLQKVITENRWFADDETTYTLNYSLRGGKSAWTPYFADLSSASQEIWNEGDGRIRKKAACNSLTLNGINNNLDYNSYEWIANDLSDRTPQEQEMLAWYNQYALEHYCGGSDDVPALDDYVQKVQQRSRSDYWIEYKSENENALSTNSERILLAEVVKSVLEEEAEYNLYLNDLPDGTDTVQYFLESGHEGYCMHFASAATLLLQKMGVPARYASGYVVKDSGFTSEDGEYVNTVTDRNGHAWVEIYLDNVGWIPYEVTPGYSNIGSSLPTDEANTAELQQKHEQRNSAQSTQNPAAASQPETGNADTQHLEETQTPVETQAPEASQNSATGSAAATQKHSVWIRVLIAVLVGVLLLLIGLELYVQRTRREKLQMRQVLRRRQYRREALRVNQRIYRSLQRHSFKQLRLPRRKLVGHGLELPSMTDEEYLHKLIAAYPAIGGEDWRAFLQIVQKAAFSREEITQDEVQFCYRIYRKL